jgi:hypothetical protein
MLELTFESQSDPSHGPSFLDSLSAQGLCVIADPIKGTAALVIGAHRLDGELTMRGNELNSAVAYDPKICAILLSDPQIVQQWLQASIRQWLGRKDQVRIAVDSREEESGYSVRVEAYVPVSSVEIEMSTEADADILRWKETGLDSQCVSYDDIDKAEALKIMAANGIDIPADADPTGWYRNEYGGNTNAFILRFEHRIPDTSSEYLEDLQKHPAGFPQTYQYPGFVTVENDFFQCTIDTKRRCVVSLHRKWQRVEAETLFASPVAALKG